jgi:flagellar biogenesis protein FliO
MARWQTTLRALTLGIFLCPSATDLRGEEPAGAQVLFSFDRKEAEAAELATPQEGPVLQAPVAQPEHREQLTAKIDSQVVPASHEASTPAAPLTSDRRRLAPLSRTDLMTRPLAESERKLPFEIPHVESLGTAGAGLVLVVGLFLLCVSLMRRGGPSPTSPLPSDAVAVLGRIPLTPKQYAHLIQVGNKLVLVSITGERTDTITEVTEPAEVERLLVMCLKGSRQSSSAEFQKLLAQMAKEPARGFVGRETAPYSRTARG